MSINGGLASNILSMKDVCVVEKKKKEPYNTIN